MIHALLRIHISTVALLAAVLVVAAVVPAHAQDDDRNILYWTCGMHPTVKSETAGKCPICNMDLVPVYVQPAGAVPEGASKAVELVIGTDAARLARIRTVEVARRMLSKTIRAAGRVIYDETSLAVVSARVGGRIEHLYADYTGKEFSAGEPIAAIYSPELLSAQKEFILARGSTLEPAAREKLRLWGITEKQISELAGRGEPWTELTVHAPTGGTVIHKNIMEGAYVREGEPLVHLADLDRVWIVADVFEHDLDAVATGQHAIISPEARPGQTFDGEVTFIEPVLDTKTRSAKIRIETGNKDRALMPGMFVRVEIHIPIMPADSHETETAHGTMHTQETVEHDGVLAVPRSAVINTGTRTVAFVEIAPGRYELRRVRIGPMAEGFYVILDGLREGERVVERGSFLLDSQTQLTGEAEEVYGGAIGKESGKKDSQIQHRH